MCEEAIEIRLKLLGKDHPDTADSYEILALYLQQFPIEQFRQAAARCKYLKIDADAAGKEAVLQPLFKILDIRVKLPH